jgi:hypothetical protein
MALTSSQFDGDGAKRVEEAYWAKFGSKPDVIRAHTDDGASLVKEAP